MKTIAKILIVIALFAIPLSFSHCAATRSSNNGGKKDSLITISRGEYDLLKQRADERYVFVQRRTFDSLLMKTKALQEVNDILVKHLPEEVRTENNFPNNKPIDK